MSLQRLILAYPWDMALEEPRQAVRSMHEIGCTGLVLNGSYHGGRFLHPRRSSGLINQRTSAGVSFLPNQSVYERMDAPHPIVDSVADGKIHTTSRDEAASRGLSFHLWLVLLHNSALGSVYPELTTVNALGDRYRYALCPAQPKARSYALALVQDACEQFAPDSVLVESHGFHGIYHGEHHELIPRSIGRVAEVLLGLCFCDACRRRGGQAGVDVKRLQADVAVSIRQLLNEERGRLSVSFMQDELAAFLLERPDLYRYVRCRLETVTGLLAELKETALRYGVKLMVTSSVFVRPITRAWEEGVDLAATAQHVDATFLSTYHADNEEVAADIDWFVQATGGAPFVVGLNPSSPSVRSSDDLAGKVLLARRKGAVAVAYYNYGLLTQKRLEWIAEAHQMVQ